MNPHLSPSLCLPLHQIRIPTDSNTVSQIAALCGIGQPEFAGNLYTFLVAQPSYATTEARQALVRRLREALVKSVSIVGVCRPLVAVQYITAVERAEDKDYSSTRYARRDFFSLFIWSLRLFECQSERLTRTYLYASENWQSGPENHARGVAWLDRVYQRNRTGAINAMAAHKDFGKKENPLYYTYIPHL